MKDFLNKVPEDSVIMPYGLPLVNLQAWVSGPFVLARKSKDVYHRTNCSQFVHVFHVLCY